MSRGFTLVATFATSAALGAGVLAPAPANADVLSDLLDSLHADEAEEPGDSTDTATGATSAEDGTLKRGCHTYAFAYALDLPTDEWTLETSIVDRRGDGVASHAYMGPAHPTAQEVTYRLCRWATVPGTFRIRAKLHWYDGEKELGFTKLPVTKFRLARRR